MTMTAIGEAFSAATSFFGLGARLRADGPDDGAMIAAEPDTFDPHPDALAPGEPCFEAVAQALTEAGYLDS